MAEDDGGLGVITLVAAVVSMVKIARDIISPVPGESTMVAIPSDMEIYVLIAAIAFAFFFGICAFLYRYAEHNAKYDLKVKDNKVFGKGGLKFVGAELMAIALTAVLAYYGAAVAPFKLGIAEPALMDYILVTGVIALVCGILLTILFNEGISGLGKFLKQKADETAEAIKDVSEAVLKAKAVAEAEAKKYGMGKKATKAYVAEKVAEAEAAEAAEAAADAEAPAEDEGAPLEGAQ